MDKGIFYLVCSLVIVGAVVFSGYTTSKAVQSQCVGKTVVQNVMVTPSPTATPTAALKFLLKPTVRVAPTK